MSDCVIRLTGTMPISVVEAHALGRHGAYPRPRCPDCKAAVEARGKATIEPEPRMKLGDGSLAPVTYEVRLPDGWRFDDGTHAKVCASRDEAVKELGTPIEPCPADCECRGDGQ